VLEERDYKGAKELTSIKEYSLKKASSFLRRIENIFQTSYPPDEAVEKFKNLFTSEVKFNKHIYKHAIPDELISEIARNLNLDLTKDWKIIFQNIPEQVKKDKAYEYFVKTLRALAYPSKVFYELPNNPKAKPVITIFSGKGEWFCVTLEGDKILSSYKLRKGEFKSLDEWKHGRLDLKRKGLIKDFEEVGIDEEIRKVAYRLRQILKHYER